MKIGALREIFASRSRVATTPDAAHHLQKLGHTCVIETGAGARAGFSDAAYTAAGVEVLTSAQALFETANVITKVRPPTDVPTPITRWRAPTGS